MSRLSLRYFTVSMANEVRLLLDAQATLASLRSLLATLPTELAAEDRLILYFAGHGIAEDLEEHATGSQGFLLSQDVKRDDPTTFLPMTEVQEQPSRMPSPPPRDARRLLRRCLPLGV